VSPIEDYPQPPTRSLSALREQRPELTMDQVRAVAVAFDHFHRAAERRDPKSRRRVLRPARVTP
jgi:hypothetical protein